MSELRVNDKVLTAGGSFKKIFAFQHFAPEASSGGDKSTYRKITTESFQEIVLTPRHMIYFHNAKYPVEASKIKTGDQVLFQESVHTAPSPTTVVSVEDVLVSGGYAPLTEDGTIVVNGIVASSYSNPPGHGSEYVELVGVPIIHRQALLHALMTPVGLFCSYISDAPCGKQVDGRSETKMPIDVFVTKIYDEVMRLGVVFDLTIAAALLLVVISVNSHKKSS